MAASVATEMNLKQVRALAKTVGVPFVVGWTPPVPGAAQKIRLVESHPCFPQRQASHDFSSEEEALSWLTRRINGG